MGSKARSSVFSRKRESASEKIGKIYVINLDRRPDRWGLMARELEHIIADSGEGLNSLTERFSAVDGRLLENEEFDPTHIRRSYTLRDQLLIEPQPTVKLEKIDLDAEIKMTRQEIAVALSHIEIWKKIAAGENTFSLVMEDDVYFKYRFQLLLEKAWIDLQNLGAITEPFDLFYLSYTEVKNRAEKSDLTDNVFIPHRGLWCLSGYVLSKEGAQKLLSLLPVRGPVDLWINHQFKRLKVFATAKSIINQRADFQSSNSYSILPVLSQIGAMSDGTPSLFETKKNIKAPVFAFGDENSGLTSLAMALSMLGYRCCSDSRELPSEEFTRLMNRDTSRIFDAYVNVGSLKNKFKKLAELYPTSKFIQLKNPNSKGVNLDESNVIDGDRVLTLVSNQKNKWNDLCEFLQLPPPASLYPDLPDLSQRNLTGIDQQTRSRLPKTTRLASDYSPWIIPLDSGGMSFATTRASNRVKDGSDSYIDNFETFQDSFWQLRNDTFPSNLALFSPQNVSLNDAGAMLLLKREPMGVREYSAASISSIKAFSFGGFEAKIKPSNVPGVITGVFLHRNSPRQEIDIEFLGKDPTKLLVNVYYNPGDEGAMFDYGYRGTPAIIDLGFDASSEFHNYRIEWDPDFIRWYVDNRLVHERLNWEPTPIPHLPMQFHVNIWPSRSEELAGKLKDRRLPARSFLRSIQHQSLGQPSHSRRE